MNIPRSSTNYTKKDSVEDKYDLIVKEIEKDSKQFWEIRFRCSDSYVTCDFQPTRKDILFKIAEIILSDNSFSGCKVKFKNKSYYLETSTGKEINLLKDGKLISDLDLVKKLSFQNINELDICPITIETVEEMLKNNVKIYKIKGENNPYRLEDLQKILSKDGISPITRNKFTKDDIFEWVQEDNTNLPFGIFKKSKKRKIIYINKESSAPENKEETKSNEESKPINLICLVDVSGSMEYFSKQNISTEPLIKYIDNLHNDSFVSLYTFGSDFKCNFSKKEKSKLDTSILHEELYPDGGTYFYGSLLKVLNDWDNIKEDGIKNLLLIITDGSDNNSYESEKEEINRLKETVWNNIDCYFMHPTNIDGSILLNIPAGQCLAFDNDNKHTSAAIDGLSLLTRSYSKNEYRVIPTIPRIVRDASSQAYICSDNENSDEDNPYETPPKKLRYLHSAPM